VIVAIFRMTIRRKIDDSAHDGHEYGEYS
jgi:hypothetical protein